MLYNALTVIEYIPLDTIDKTIANIKDLNQIAPWANEAAVTLYNAGIINGNNNRLNPTSNTTRAEIAQVLFNLLIK